MPRLLPLLIAALLTAAVPRTSALEPLDAPALHTTLRDLIDTHPTAKRTHVALKVIDLETGEVLFDQNSDKLFTPASNLKIYTSAAALDLLGPEYRWTTKVLTCDVHQDGVLKDGVFIEGGGDPMFDTVQLAAITAKLLESPDADFFGCDFGVATREGWDQVPLKGPGWMWDDDPDYYNMSIQSLMLNFNVIEFTISPGESIGSSVKVRSNPLVFRQRKDHGIPIKDRNGTDYRLIYNTGNTTDSGRTNATIDRKPFDHYFFATGDMPIGSKSTTINASVHEPSDWICSVFIQQLVDQNANFSKFPRVVTVKPAEAAFHFNLSSEPSTLSIFRSEEERILVEHQGKTNAEAVKHFLKVSENAVGEMLLLTLSEKFGEGEQVSWPSGAKVISDWLVNTAGLEDGSFRLVDGSGLSRYNLISADSSIRLLAYMKNESEHFEPFFDGLPIYQVALPEGGKWGGVPVAEFDAERVFAKPGGMSGVSTISGYVQTLDGRWLAFSLLGNGYIGSSAPVRDLRNQVWAELVRYQPAAVAVPADGVSP